MESMRLSQRLASNPGTRSAWFITVCTHDLTCALAEIRDGRLVLSSLGWIAWSCWWTIPDHFPLVLPDAFVAMPNHLHGILWMPQNEKHGAGMTPGSLPVVVRSFKSEMSYRVNRLQHSEGRRVWQRSFFRSRIRTEPELARLRGYILANPATWDRDRFHPKPGN